MENVLQQIKSSIDSKKISAPEFGRSCSVACKNVLLLTGPKKVIEIGTAYGFSLSTFANLSSFVVSVDPMYDWVPDVKEKDGFNESKVDQKKISTWKSNVEIFKEKVKLIVGNSYMVHEMQEYAEDLKESEILIVDGCHHPAELVEKDYFNFQKHMANPHYVIWDDNQENDVRNAISSAKKKLTERGYKFEELVFFNATIMFVSK